MPNMFTRSHASPGRWTECPATLAGRPAGGAVFGMVALGRTIPALPVRHVSNAVAYFHDRLGFEPIHVDDGFAVVQRDDARIHLWCADDTGWPVRQDLCQRPIASGAESFLAGTASCRIETEGVDDLYAQLAATNVLHPASQEGVTDTNFGTREFATVDADGNLIEFFHWVQDLQ